jgi:hypothetical protein
LLGEVATLVLEVGELLAQLFSLRACGSQHLDRIGLTVWRKDEWAAARAGGSSSDRRGTRSWGNRRNWLLRHAHQSASTVMVSRPSLRALRIDGF